MYGREGAVNIRVIPFAPLYPDDINKIYRQERGFLEKSLEHIPCRVWGNPEQMGDIAVFLASEAASYINGSNLVADGGYMVF